MSARVLQLDPVELDVLPRGEMAVAAVVVLGDRRRAGAAGATTACRREWRCAAYRRGAADRGRSSAASGWNSSSVSSPERRRCAWSRNCAMRSRTKLLVELVIAIHGAQPPSGWKAPPSLRPACRDRPDRGPKGADALADVERADLPVRAFGLEQIGAGDQSWLSPPPCRALRAPRPSLRLERQHGIVDPLAPFAGAGEEHDLAVAQAVGGQHLAGVDRASLSIFLTGTVMTLLRSLRHGIRRRGRKGQDGGRLPRFCQADIDDGRAIHRCARSSPPTGQCWSRWCARLASVPFSTMVTGVAGSMPAASSRAAICRRRRRPYRSANACSGFGERRPILLGEAVLGGAGEERDGRVAGRAGSAAGRSRRHSRAPR